MSWTRYWPLYQRLEQELEEMTFAIALVDDQRQVYSSKLAELLMRACSECENAAKALLVGRALASTKDNFPGLGADLCSSLHLDWRELEIVWPFQQLTTRTIVPFKTWASGNPTWFTAYNKIKHDRDANTQAGNYWNVIEAVGGLFILNVWLRFSVPRFEVQVELLDDEELSLSRFFAHDELFLPPDPVYSAAPQGRRLNEVARRHPFYAGV